MTERRDTFIELAALKALKDEIDTRYAIAREAAADHLDPGDRKSVVLPDGQDIGTVTYSKSKTAARVVDATMLLEWTRLNAPGEIVTTEQVRGSFASALVARVENVDGRAIDPKTGEDIPGLAFVESAPYVSARQSDGQRQAFVRAYIDGHLTVNLGQMLAYRATLPAGGA